MRMKKVLLTFIIGIALLSACGPTNKEIEEQRIADSIRVADSLAMIQVEQQRIADSITKALCEKQFIDSIEAAHTPKCSKKTR